MKLLLKKFFLLLFIIVFSGAINAKAEIKNYKIVSYAWGSNYGRGMQSVVWSKLKKVNYEIIFDNDEKNPTIEIKEKKKSTKYKLLNWGFDQPELNYTASGWKMHRIIAEKDNGHHCRIIIRENEDGRIFFYFIESAIYAYGTAKDEQMLSDTVPLTEE